MAIRVSKSASVFVLIAALCISTSVPAIAAPLSDPSTGDENQQSTVPTLQTTANNSTDDSTNHHVNPNNATGEGDLLQVRGWLTSQLADKLSRSAITISQSQYELGRSLLGDQYDSRLGQLVDVVGETRSDEDDGLGDTFNDVQRTQRNFSKAAQNYEETYEAYQQAVENGNESAARRHARRLQDIANRLQRLNQSLGEDYEDLGNQTAANFTQAIESISTLTENFTSRQARVEETLFTETTLQVTTDSERISYRNPLVASGQLVTEDDTPVSNREITIRVGEQTKQVRTDEEGRFSLQYRPRLIPVNTSQLSIRYIPQNESQYLRSNTSLAVTVAQVEANLTITSIPSSTSFGDQFEMQVRATWKGEPISGVPVEATLDRYQLTQQWTGNNGSGVFIANIPASVPTGEQPVTVSMAAEDRAVKLTPVSATISVQPTNTTLSLKGERIGKNQIRISGHLATTEGLGVPEQTVQLSINKSIERSVETNQNGTVALLVNQSELPAGVNTSVLVTATFSGEATNLEPTSATERVTFKPLETGESQSTDPETKPSNPGTQADGTIDKIRRSISRGIPLTVLVIGILVGGALLVLAWRYFRSSRSTVEDTNRAMAESEDSTDELETLDLSHGQSLAEERPEAAVLWAYQNVREYLGGLIGVKDSDTHWEFYAKCQQQNLNEAQLSKLQDLVEAFETVRFHRSETDIDVDAIIAELDAERWSENPTGNSAD